MPKNSYELYIYSSLHLVQHLNEMRERLVMQKKVADAGKKKWFIQKKIDQINAVLGLPYFDPFAKDETRAELISKVKHDRDKFKEIKQEFVKNNNFEKRRLDCEEIKTRIKYFQEANPDNDEIMLELWEELERCNAFKSIEAEYDKIQHDIDVRKWLLGMIHRPNGYFEKAWK